MLTKDQADTLRSIAQNDYMIDTRYLPAGEQLCDIASVIENKVAIAASDDAKYQALQEIGNGCASALAEMAAALECDYDRLEELRENAANNRNVLIAYTERMEDWQANADAQAELDELAEIEKAAGDCESREDAEQRIQEDPLSIELAGKWPLGSTPEVDRAYILLGTGGPATRIVCELDASMEPHRAWIEAQDWGTPWTEYHGDAISSDDLLTYCRCFFFGEG